MTNQTKELHAAIMNLPCDHSKACATNNAPAYKIGHRDARHEAAELASAYTAAPLAQAPAELPATGEALTDAQIIARLTAAGFEQEDDRLVLYVDGMADVLIDVSGALTIARAALKGGA